jgi:hypothetical protein
MQESQDWCERIGRAASEERLVATLREFCAKSLGARLAKLPGDVPPCEVRSADDIVERALDLIAYEVAFAGCAEERSVLREVASVFTTASQQLGWLRHRREAGSR